MDKALIQSLAKFCADQQDAFNAEAWLAVRGGESQNSSVAFATIAKYLSMTSWYGHEEELEAIAVELYAPLASPGEFERVAHDCDFDTGGFSVALRYRLAMRQLGLNVQDASRKSPEAGSASSSAGDNTVTGQVKRGLGQPG